MHPINLAFDDEEWIILQKKKGTRSWRKFILDCAKVEEEGTKEE